ncbi:MAG: hypothetical protein GY820_40380, partial [Gammaproteobacteria bacterium]|nr:hypothetical protein [Gammaproteobacteria bacterium]
RRLKFSERREIELQQPTFSKGVHTYIREQSGEMPEDTVPRAEFEQLRTLLQEVRQQQQQNSANTAIQPLQTALQTLSVSQANQVVYSELAKTPLFSGNGTTSIDKWLKTVVSVLQQCSAPTELRASLLLGRLKGNAAQYAATLPNETQSNLKALCTSLREKYCTANDSESAKLFLHNRRQGEGETMTQFGQALVELAEIAYGEKISDEHAELPPNQKHLQETLKTLFLRGLKPEFQQLARVLHPDQEMSYRALVTWATRLQSRMDWPTVGGEELTPHNALDVAGASTPFGLLGAVAVTPSFPQGRHAGRGGTQSPGWARPLGPLHPTANSSGGRGHIAASEIDQGIRANRPQALRHAPRRYCMKCNSTDHEGAMCSLRPGSCLICNSPQHYQNRCPNRPRGNQSGTSGGNRQGRIPPSQTPRNNTNGFNHQQNRNRNRADFQRTSGNQSYIRQVTMEEDRSASPSTNPSQQNDSNLLREIHDKLTHWERAALAAADEESGDSSQIHMISRAEDIFNGEVVIKRVEPPMHGQTWWEGNHLTIATGQEASGKRECNTEEFQNAQSSERLDLTPLMQDERSPAPSETQHCGKAGMDSCPQARARWSSGSCQKHGIPMLLLVCIFALCMPAKASSLQIEQTFRQCGGSRTGTLVEYPSVPKCGDVRQKDTLPRGQREKPISYARVKLFVSRISPEVTSAFSCRLRTETICTYTSFFGGKGILRDVVEERALSPQQCEKYTTAVQRGQTPTFQSKPLLQEAERVWSTQNVLKVHYKWCCYTYCQSVMNLIIEQGQVASMDGIKIQSDLADTGHCVAKVGHCQSPHVVVIWPARILVQKAKCTYEKRGSYEAKIRGSFVIIEKL